MPKDVMKTALVAATPEDLYEKFKDQLTKEQFIFVNVLVLQNLSPVDALLIAYPKTEKWSQASRQVRASQLLQKYLHPYVRQYYDELVKLIGEEMKEQLNWSKERAVKELVGIVNDVNEEAKPFLTKDGAILKPSVSKTRMDAKIQAITELNKISGITSDTKNIINIPVVFSGESDIEKQAEEEQNGRTNKEDN